MKSEFEFINDLKSRFSLDKVGDDCAVLPKDDKTDLLITADLLIEDIDFRLEWTTPEFLGHKALAVSLSDIAAMGGTPKWALLSIGAAENLWKTDFLERLYAGWHSLAARYGVELVGGDVSRSPDKLVIDSIVGGEVEHGKAILRSGARPGEGIFVTGTLGGAAGGLKLLERGLLYEPNTPDHARDLLLKQLQPQPQLSVANKLISKEIVTSMTDVSDGLSGDLGHICEASGVGAKIYAERLPIDPDLTHHFPAEQCHEFALHGGEDFGLLSTCRPEKNLGAQIADISHIGEITADTGIIELIHENETMILEPKSYLHFA